MCFIICGGPSVADHDLARLHGHHVIAVNTSVFSYAQADYLVFSDKRWWTKWHTDVVHRYHGRVVAVTPMKPDPRYLLMLRAPNGGLADRTDALAVWHTTVTAAVNLAVHLGARTINFLGLDGKDRDGKSWHHDDHPAEWPRYAQRYYYHGKALEQVAEAMSKIGVLGYNANPHAAHRMFPHKSFEEMVA